MSQDKTRKEREQERHRDEILAAAEEVFSEKGFYGATVEEVAKRAEFAVGTVYKFFSSKDILYRSLLEVRCGQLGAEGNALLDAADDPVAQVTAYVDAKIALCCKYLPFVKLYTRERLGDRFSDTELWHEVVAPIHSGFMQRLTESFARGIANGCFRNDLAAEDMAVALEGISDGFLHQWLQWPDEHSFEAKRDAMLDLFLDGVKSR